MEICRKGMNHMKATGTKAPKAREPRRPRPVMGLQSHRIALDLMVDAMKGAGASGDEGASAILTSYVKSLRRKMKKWERVRIEYEE